VPASVASVVSRNYHETATPDSRFYYPVEETKKNRKKRPEKNSCGKITRKNRLFLAKNFPCEKSGFRPRARFKAMMMPSICSCRNNK
jgi:hypothetical protein